ncbi:hypothetical protein K488DRAFT_22223, partial [Vararia minispora EC-137]
CPLCEHIGTTGRMPDLKRHIKAHNHDVARLDNMCLGIPELDSGGMPTGRRLYACYKSFSRRDALTRHMKSTKQGCKGD